MDIEELKTIIINGSTSEKVYIFSYLVDVFNSYSKNIMNLQEILEVLIDYVVTSPDDDAKSEALDAICSAQGNQDTINIDFDKIENELIKNTFTKYIEKYIEILGNTHDKKYLQTILQFQDREEWYIKEAIHYALIEMGIEA